jgi:hypothetical protein
MTKHHQGIFHMNLGYKDRPVESLEGDILEVRDYILSLNNFIMNCETPMTIAIQGDWGSGKTSIMNMIKKEIGSDVMTIWFNTWQYSQFNMGGMLAVSLLNSITKAIDGDATMVANVFNAIRSGVGFVARTGVNFAVETLAGETNAGMVADVMSGAGVESFTQQIIDLKAKLESSLNKKLTKENKGRAVIFVDDLDRLPPEKAVELLEVMKIFMDIESAVFVLAIDYQVVVQGLEKKFGGTVGTEKGKSFFDKIIQLPFAVPVVHYKVDKYILDLLKRMNIEDATRVHLYISLINSSIGFNPRSVKRLFNSYLLLTNVAARRGLITDRDLQKKDKQRLLFAILCLQMSFTEVYGYLLKHWDEIDSVFLANLANEETYTEEIFTINHPKREEIIKKCSEFMDYFLDACDMDASEEISETEIDTLKQILSSSTITSTMTSTIEVRDEKYARVRLNSIEAFTNLMKSSKGCDTNFTKLIVEIHDKINKRFQERGKDLRVIFTGTGNMTFNIPVAKRHRVILFAKIGPNRFNYVLNERRGRLTNSGELDEGMLMQLEERYDALMAK